MRRLLGALLGAATLAGCVYKVPITAQPTRAVDERLVGDWISPDGKDRLKIRKLDDFHAVVVFNDLVFRGHHSDLGTDAFVSLQDLDNPERRFAYVAWRLEEGGHRLVWRGVKREVVPQALEDSAAVQALLEQHRGDAALFDREHEYLKLPLR